jgi:hypothetical protein
VHGSPSLPQVLVESLRTRVRETHETMVFQLAVRAAVSSDREHRAWLLVELATRLRREHEIDLARIAAEGAVALDAGVPATRAASTCLVSLYADEDELAAAVELGEALLASGEDAYLLKTMARVYREQWRKTKDEDWHERWWRVHVRLHERSPA